RLDEECLLKIVVDDVGGPKEIALATRDTPEALRKPLEEDKARRAAEGASSGDQGGLFSSLRRILGRG
uniref:hypothetical protein n=1 Tax=Salmonella enterica TaxID=28901 RepID=UPI0032979D10